VGQRTAVLRVLDSTPAGARTVPLLLEGIDVPGSVRELTLTTVTDAAHLSFAPPGTNGGRDVSGYRIARSTDGGPPVVVATLQPGPSRLTHTDAGLQRGHRYAYTVTAVNSVGAGPAAGTEAQTLVAREIIAAASRDDAFTYDLVRLPLPHQSARSVPLLTAGDLATPALSPDATRLAYAAANGSGGYGIVVADRNGGRPRVLTSGADDGAPAFSPDGRTLVFVRASGSSTSLLTVPVAGGAATAVPGSTGLGRAAFTRDGRRLVSSTIGDGSTRRCRPW
jgi:hypothetical protein